MVNGIRTIYIRGLSKGFGSMFCVGCVRQETPEVDQSIHQPKLCEVNNKDENKNLNVPSDKH